MSREYPDVVAEIRQLIEQYRQEVTGRRRAWPEAIKSRVRELHEFGLKGKEIAALTNLSYFTIMGWLAKEVTPAKEAGARDELAGHFAPVRIKRAKNPIATVIVEKLLRARR